MLTVGDRQLTSALPQDGLALMASEPDPRLLAMEKTLETLLLEREALVHESARLGQEVRQLRQVAGGDAESQTAQVLMLKEIVAALTVRRRYMYARSPAAATPDGLACAFAARKPAARAAGRDPAGCAASHPAAATAYCWGILGTPRRQQRRLGVAEERGQQQRWGRGLYCDGRGDGRRRWLRRLQPR